MTTNPTVQDAVREKYGAIARDAGKTGCCGPTRLRLRRPDHLGSLF